MSAEAGFFLHSSWPQKGSESKNVPTGTKGNSVSLLSYWLLAKWESWTFATVFHTWVMHSRQLLKKNPHFQGKLVKCGYSINTKPQQQSGVSHFGLCFFRRQARLHFRSHCWENMILFWPVWLCCSHLIHYSSLYIMVMMSVNSCS